MRMYIHSSIHYLAAILALTSPFVSQGKEVSDPGAPITDWYTKPVVGKVSSIYISRPLPPRSMPCP